MLEKSIALKLIDGKPGHLDFEIIPGVRTKGSYDPSGMWKELNLPNDMASRSARLDAD